jgi:hypothetical protein
MPAINLTNRLGSLATGGRAASRAFLTNIENSIPRVLDDILKTSGKSLSELLGVDLKNVLKSNEIYKSIFADTVDEASMLRHNKTFKELVTDPKTKPEAETLVRQIHDDLTKDISDNLIKRKEALKTDAKKIRNDIKAAAGNTIEVEGLKKLLQQNKDASDVLKEFKKQFQGFPTKTTDELVKLFDEIQASKVDPNLNPNSIVNVSTKDGILRGTWDKISKTKVVTYIVKNKIKSALIGLGIPVGAAVYYMLNSKSGGQPYIALDENGNPINPTEGSQLFPPCVQELINSGEAEIRKAADGSSVVYHKESNIYFYTKGGVYDATKKKRGTYKCKGTQVAENKSKKLTLHNILNEVVSVIDQATMGKYLDSSIDILDGLVVTADLRKLKNILTQLYGKTYNGENAIQYLMKRYSQNENSNFIDDVNSVGTRTLGLEAMELKDDILNLASGGSGGQIPTTGEKKGLGGIDITWDGASSPAPAPEAKRTSGGQPNYFDCSQKDFPYQYGCISPRIAEIQTCMGITPNKGYFGPKTRREIGIDRDVITKELYDSIMANCAGKSSVNSDAIKQATMDTSKKELDAKGIGKFKPSSVQRPSYVDYNEPAYNPNVQPNEAD